MAKGVGKLSSWGRKEDSILINIFPVNYNIFHNLIYAYLICFIPHSINYFSTHYIKYR